MNVAKALQKDNLDILYAGLLIGRYLLLTRRAAEGYTPLTIALQVRAPWCQAFKNRSSHPA
jgi:hypothetical protein